VPDRGIQKESQEEEMTSNTDKNASACAIAWPERMVRRLAGSFVVVSLLLAWQVNPWWLALAGFVGVNLLQSSFTGFCPAEMFFRWMDARRSAKISASTN